MPRAPRIFTNCSNLVIRCFKRVEHFADWLTGAAGPVFVFLCWTLIILGGVSFSDAVISRCGGPHAVVDQHDTALPNSAARPAEPLWPILSGRLGPAWLPLTETAGEAIKVAGTEQNERVVAYAVGVETEEQSDVDGIFWVWSERGGETGPTVSEMRWA
ncbi:hypothetical protein P7C73_g6455, partial [Tremellales sp. Uapishka_1]